MKRLFLFATIVSVVTCRQGQEGSAERASVADVSSACLSVHFPVENSQSDSVSAARNCTLVRDAYRAIATGTGSATGVPSADTAAIRAARVTHFVFRDTSSTVSDAYWSVDFRLADRDYDATVHVSDPERKLTIGRTHKPF